MAEARSRRRRRWLWAAGTAVVVVLVVVGVGLVRSDDDDPGPAAGGREDCARSSVDLIRDAHAGRAEGVRAALADGDDPNEADDHGNTPLACALPVGSTEVVSALLDAGADPGTEDRFGDTVVADAVRFCHDEVLALLLDAGADPDEPGIEPRPLVQAVDLGSSRSVELLLAAGADPDPTPDAVTLRGDEDESQCPVPSDGRQAEALAVVLAGGGEPDAVLERAVQLGGWDAVPATLGAGADPDADVDQHLALGGLGCSPSVLAPEDIPAECGPVLGVLALAGQDVDPTEVGRDPAPTTALVHAAWAGEVEAAGALIDAGADPDVVGPSGVTALAAAAGAGADAVVDLLLPLVTLPVGAGTVVASEVAEAAGHADLAERLRLASA